LQIFHFSTEDLLKDCRAFLVIDLRIDTRFEFESPRMECQFDDRLSEWNKYKQKIQARQVHV